MGEGGWDAGEGEGGVMDVGGGDDEHDCGGCVVGGKSWDDGHGWLWGNVGVMLEVVGRVWNSVDLMTIERWRGGGNGIICIFASSLGTKLAAAYLVQYHTMRVNIITALLVGLCFG